MEKIKKRFEGKVVPEPNSGCWIWTGAIHSKIFPYGKMRVNGKSLNCHLLSWILYRGEIPKGFQVLHHCDIPSCVNPNHLFLGTQKDNMNDAVQKKRHRHMVFHGEQHPAAKLTWKEVTKIRTDKRLLKILAKEYNVSTTTISEIRLGHIWKNASQ